MFFQNYTKYSQIVNNIVWQLDRHSFSDVINLNDNKGKNGINNIFYFT